jgi:hypothetical protein
MGSIPHGTTILGQGASSNSSGAPVIPDNNILPFVIGDPGNTINFPEQNLSVPSEFRSPAPQLVGITQDMVNNPNSVLQAAIAGQTILQTTTLQGSTVAPPPITGGGTAKTAFLAGAAVSGGGPNAVGAQMTATFWIESVQGYPDFLQLQYSQTVLLNFNGLSWPHITVGTLRKNQPLSLSIERVDPDIPKELLEQFEPPFDTGVGAPPKRRPSTKK